MIDYSFFISPIGVPGIAEATTRQALLPFINIREPEFLNLALGREFARLFTTGLAAPSPAARWTNLKQGADYAYEGETYSYKGLAHAGSELIDRYSPIAKYIYYWWLRDDSNVLGRLGGANSEAENATRTDTAQRQTDAYNSIFEDLVELYEFLLRQPSVYPEFKVDKARWYCEFEKITVNSL